MKKLIFSLIAMAMVALNAVAVAPDSVRYYHHTTDTAVVNSILKKTRAAHITTPAERVAFIAKQFLGTPYKSATLEGDTEVLTVNLSELDCTTFIENVLALAHTAAIDSATVDDFVAKLQEIRYRDGEIDGYASRLHYACDWVTDNAKRGNFSEVTDKLPKAAKQSIELNYMSAHRSSYPALKNDSVYKQIQEVEKGYKVYRYSYIPKSMLNNPMLLNHIKEGDIVLITTSTKGLDVMHMGVVIVKNRQPYLLHASSAGKAVMITAQPLGSYLATLNAATGIRIVRM